MNRLTFLDQEPPPGYIAGIGRGATGFVTQADLGSSRKLPIVSFERKSSEDDDGNDRQEPGGILSEAGQFEDAKFDLKPSGLTGDKEDIEADSIYDEVERYLERKRKKKQKSEAPKTDLDTGVLAKIESTGKSIQGIAGQFEDVKQGLASVSKEEWEALPESGDFTRKNKRLRNELQEQQRFYRNSDMLALSLKNSGATNLVLDEANEEVENDNDEAEANGDNKIVNDDVNLLELSRTKDRLLEYRIKMGNQAASTELDKSDYLEKLVPSSKYNIGDYQKTRRLFAKLRETSPHSPQNWIASARLEYDARKFNKARLLIQEGCEKCPRSEEIWLTNLEFNSDDITASKVIVADAIKYNFKSIPLWFKAVELEHDNLSKVRVLRKALELQPKVPLLWLEIIKYEQDKNISIKMIQKATEVIPDSLEIWTALADLQDIDDSIATLTNSINYISDEKKYKVWITIAKLEEERSSNEVKINRLIAKGFEMLDGASNFEEWFNQARLCECEKRILTCRSIILKLLTENSENNTKKLIDISKEEYAQNHLEISDTILFFITSNYPKQLNSWTEFFELKRNTGDFKALFLAYEMAITSLPKCMELYLMYAKDKLKFDEDFEKVRSILADALEQVPTSEVVWIFTIEFEIKAGSNLVVRELFEACLNNLPDPSINIWIKRINFEKSLGNYSSALEFGTIALHKHPDEYILYLLKSEISETIDDFKSAKTIIETGIKKCKSNELLYIHLAQIYEKNFTNLIKSRSILEEALAKHPKSDKVHHARILLELRSGNKVHGDRLLSKALTLIPSSAILWCENIRLVSKQQAKNVYAMALKKTCDDPMVILTIAHDLWKNGKIDKANQFFNACIKKDPKYGDAYIYYYAFLLKFGSKQEMKNLEEQLSNHFEFFHGHYWAELIKKNENKGVDHIQLARDAAVNVFKSV